MMGRVVPRKKLALYAALLGRDSSAAKHLVLYDTLTKLGLKPVIRMNNNDFTFTVKEEVAK